ncbi:TetR/AcrR family transcriptional regulator [Bacillus sp. HMF5848]|uniref:TetR/AcrR family transcriptional regulator n=1 Tax=Bacillus sp. HMF5848 TaxID=2495421 RepID=UPI000F780C4F|nr:TetR/AcrR family transcriptional regulator [Bacillus sp. HMF5848]RSK28547.1 TetR/AcrR family transcriptional regulator [Bacillus sp. HMF5848]
MPKDTFFNLATEKREHILQVAIEEFAQYTYHKASISRIVEKAGIAKGSFYQYFQDKKDLFVYIMENSAQKKMTYLAATLQSIDTHPFFQIVEELSLAGIQFAKDHPLLSKISDDFMKEPNIGLKKQILGDNLPKSYEFFEMLLKKAAEKGEIKADIDYKIVAILITNGITALGEHHIHENSDSDKYVEDIMQSIRKMLRILENGIKN